MKKALGFCLFVALFVSGSWARKHPVPLDAKTDSAKCLECHQDKTKGAVVHSAVPMGCLSCHEVRIIKSRDKQHEDITRVKLIKASPTSQCLSCHEDLKGGPGKSKTHAPVTRNCLTCHEAHVSANKGLLVKTAAGDKKENLCLQCHDQGVNVAKGGSRHAALDMGCDSCHSTHKIGAPDKRENQFHLTQDSPALCIACHDPKEDTLKKAHHNQPIDKADCLTCHDPHQSNKPKLAQRFQHAPFASGECETCHAAAKDGKVVLTNADSRALCVTCHAEQAEQMQKATVQHPGAQGECIACHSPHASRSDRLLSPDPVKICENCHSEQAQLHKTAPFLHPAAFRDGCFTCHSGHGGQRPKLLRAEGNALCLECHSPRRSPKYDAATGTVSIFNGAVRMPGDYFARLPMLGLLNMDTAGHPTAGHPVTAAIDRGDPDKKRPMTCMSCHKPHAGASTRMFVTDTATSMPLCGRCHHGEIGGVPDAAGNPSGTPSPAPAGKSKRKKK